jgi:N-alpha-acetyltransferase 35, NatC auxiliary subunit
MQTFALLFSFQKPQPLIFVRCLLQSFIWDDMVFVGNKSIRNVLDDDFSIMVLPCSQLLDRANDDVEAPVDPRFTVSKTMERFRQNAAQPFLDLLRTLCQNRCRVRRMLVHVVTSWDSLQVTADEADQTLQTAMKEQPVLLSAIGEDPTEGYGLPLSSWTYFHKLRQMEWMVQLGFELEVYQPDELAGMYWYLNHLAKQRAQHVERIKSFLISAINSARRPNMPTNPAFIPSLAFVRLAILDAAVTWELADALSCLYTCLRRSNLAAVPDRPYSTDELRHELRMRPWSAVGIPELPSSDHFREGAEQPGAPTLEVLGYAAKAVAGARRGFETLAKLSAEESFSVGCHARWVQAAKDGLKSSIAAGIAVAALVVIPKPGKAYHAWWIVPSITAAK